MELTSVPTKPRENYLVKCIEIRDWQLSSYVYNSSINIIKTVIDNTNINVTTSYGYNTLTGTHVLDRFYHEFFKATTFPDKMRIYCDMRTKHPEHDNDLYQNSFIEFRFHQYYDLLGGERIKALRYRDKDIETTANSKLLFQLVVNECKKTFLVGKFYLSSDVKKMLQQIYKQVGINATAKANEITNYMPTAVLKQLTTTTTGKRELYYEIQ